MAPPQKPFNDRAAGEIMLTEVFTTVQRLNAAAGQSMVKRGTRSGNMTFNPKIILADDGSRPRVQPALRWTRTWAMAWIVSFGTTRANVRTREG